MSIVTTKEMFEKASKGGYAIGAFNINNMEIIQGITEACQELNSPVILQVSGSAIKYAHPKYLLNMVKAAEEETGIPLAIHLDHGADFDICKSCVDMGFTSVMIDASKYSFDENVEMTKRVVDYAHEHGVVVEAELGKLAGVEDEVNVSDADSCYTDPDQAHEFVEKTGCDSLAIAIGTSHGAYKFKGEPKLRFDILDKVTSLMPGYPIVLHGASSVSQEDVARCNQYGGDLPGAKGVTESLLREAARHGVCKINMDTDIRIAMTAAIREEFVNNPSGFDPRKYLGSAREAIKKLVKHKIIDVLGSNDKI